MIRILFVIILFIHGLIHLLGFVKEWQLAKVEQLTGKTLIPLSGSLSKIVGAFWLLICILFVVSASVYLVKKEWWWMMAAAVLIVSQILIILYWQDARFGTIANIIILFACILSYGTWSFNRMVNDELQSLLPGISKEKKVVTTGMVASLPPVYKSGWSVPASSEKRLFKRFT